MCGIAGFYSREENADMARIRAMCDRLRHRGPDDEGFHVDGGFAMGMRRLSIIDLDAGKQPIGNEDGTVWAVFNGEIYNYRELRGELAGKGHTFRTRSDTEVLVHLYEERGSQGVQTLRGMFAFAIWDSRRRSLLLARDRFGKKPLYYALPPAGIVFGSEMKCLRAAGGVPFDLDEEALRLYFQFGYIPDPRSPFQAIRKLAAGSWLSYEACGHVRQGTYWRLPPPAEHAPPGQDRRSVCVRLRESFDEAVRMRMVADVPLGAFLSGGIDSSSVVAAMAVQSEEPVKTFSIGFEESGFNELPHAAQVARKYGTEHHEIVVRPDSAALIERLVRHFDEPYADTAAIPTFIVSEFAARHVKVALTGDGGDELFGGYESFFQIERRRIYDRVPQAVRRLLSWCADLLPYSAYGKNYLRMLSRPSALARYFESNYTAYFLRRELLQPQWMLPADAGFLTRVFADCLLPEGTEVLSQAMYFEATANLTGGMLVKVDRMSMANSLEVRCPMLDHELAELAFSIPHEWKIRNGSGKQVLLDAIGDRLPQELLTRPKTGFNTPLAVWFRGPLRDMLRDYVAGPRFLGRGFVSPRFVKCLLDEHQRGRRDNNQQLWALLMLEMWFREWGR